MSKENKKGKQREMMNEEKKEAMKVGRYYGQFKNSVNALIDHYIQKGKDEEKIAEILHSYLEKTVTSYQSSKAMEEELKQLQEKYGDKFIIKSRKGGF